MTETTTAPVAAADRPGVIDARPVRHPWRWIAIAVIAVVVAMIVSSFVTNTRWDFPFALQVMNYQPVIDGLWKGTILGTVGAMVIGIGIGVPVAVMRLSSNPVLGGVSFVFTWFFRAVPRYVLLVIIGSGLGYLYPQLTFGLPFGQQLAGALGMGQDTFTIASVATFSVTGSIWGGIIGLGLSEAAYMAEIARAGIQSVDRGQTEAAMALGMSSGKAMRRIVLPQAMRVIVPPTGNETIAMVKDTSLLAGIPIITELFYQTSAVGTRTLKIMPSFVAATAWYLIICSVLMVGQYYLERRFGRGFGVGGPARVRRFARPGGSGGA